jgi:hypothetical protein
MKPSLLRPTLPFPCCIFAGRRAKWGLGALTQNAAEAPNWKRRQHETPIVKNGRDPCIHAITDHYYRASAG